jgi:hypothetical protein
LQEKNIYILKKKRETDRERKREKRDPQHLDLISIKRWRKRLHTLWASAFSYSELVCFVLWILKERERERERERESWLARVTHSFKTSDLAMIPLAEFDHSPPDFHDLNWSRNFCTFSSSSAAHECINQSLM